MFTIFVTNNGMANKFNMKTEAWIVDTLPMNTMREKNDQDSFDEQ